jgi:hypothetical protein
MDPDSDPGSDPNQNPAPAIFVSDFQDGPTKNYFVLLSFLFINF